MACVGSDSKVRLFPKSRVGEYQQLIKVVISRQLPLAITVGIDAGINAVWPRVSLVVVPSGAISSTLPSIAITIVNESLLLRFSMCSFSISIAVAVKCLQSAITNSLFFPSGIRVGAVSATSEKLIAARDSSI